MSGKGRVEAGVQGERKGRPKGKVGGVLKEYETENQ